MSENSYSPPQEHDIASLFVTENVSPPDGGGGEFDPSSLGMSLASRLNSHNQVSSSVMELELRQQLEEAQEEMQRLRTALVPLSLQERQHREELNRVQGEKQRAIKTLKREADQRLAQYKVIAHQARQDLEQERMARRMEGSHSTFRISQLEKEVTETRSALSTTLEASAQASQSRSRKLAFTAAFALVCGLVWWFMPHVDTPSSGAAASTSAKSDDKGLPMRRYSSILDPSSFDKGFGGSLDRLNVALAAFPGQAPEAILSEVHKRAAKTDPTLCSFQWNNGQPALNYDGKGNTLSLSTTLERCAAAVEKFK